MMTKIRVHKTASWTPQVQKKETSLAPPPIAVQRLPVSGNTEVPMPEYQPLPADYTVEDRPLMRQFNQSQPIQRKSTNGASRHATVPQMQRRSQITTSYIQRDLVEDDAAHKVDSLDVVYELIAHKLAYDGQNGIKPQAGEWLDSQGYQRNWLGTVKGTGLFCGLLMPNEGSGKRPVLAFKGTEPNKSGDILADLDPISVGFTAFKLKQREIKNLIDRAGEKVDVTGHSLGGGLAQQAASAFPGDVRRVVTFQAPGISQEQVRQFNRLADDERPEVVHHIATGDLVDLAGGKHLGGSGLYTGKGDATFFFHHISHRMNAGSHTKFLLQDEAFTEQQQAEGIDADAYEAVGLEDESIGRNRKVQEYDDSPFAYRQFAIERGRELAAPGVALALGGRELARSGYKNWQRGNWKDWKNWNNSLGAIKMTGGTIAGVVGGIGAFGGGLVGGAYGGVLAGGTYAGTRAYKGGSALMSSAFSRFRRRGR